MDNQNIDPNGVNTNQDPGMQSPQDVNAYPDPQTNMQPDPLMGQGQPTPSGQTEEKDQNVYNFLVQIIQEKHGNDLPWDQITKEADGLYEKLGDALVNTFEPEMSNENRDEFNGLVGQGYKQEDLQMYLLQNIPNLEQRIQQILVDFRTNYLNS